MAIFLYFLFGVGSFVAGFALISLEADLWVILFAFAFSLVLAAVGLYKLNEETEFLAKWRARRKAARVLPYRVGDIDGAARYCASLSPRRLRRFVTERYRAMHRYINETHGKKTADVISRGFLCVFATRDGQLSRKEWALFSRCVSYMTYDEARELARDYCKNDKVNQEVHDITIKFLKILSKDMRWMFCEACIAVFVCDGKITQREKDFLLSATDYN